MGQNGNTMTEYKPGDVVNGHMLTAQGQWVPVAQPQPAPTQNTYVAPKQVQRVVAVKPINHVFHGTLTVLTGGLWGIVWGWKVLVRSWQR